MDAFERKVRPIYDALDSRNWKGAAKLANSALGKYKNNPLLKTLKAVALDRAGKSQEAFQICEEVRATVPTNDQILHTLCIVYRSTGNLDCLTKAYAAACEKDSRNQDLLHGLFGCYVREGLHSSQQQVATKIYRQIGTEKYLWWVVMSLLLQAWSEPAGVCAPMGITQTLKLAESMVERHLKGKGRLESKEALMVYIDVLHAQGKTEAALQCLEGSLGNLCPLPREKLQLEAQCHVQLRNWEKAAELFREMLNIQPDDFQALQSYLDCVLPRAAVLLRNGHGWMELHYEACQLTRRLHCESSSLEGIPDEGNIEEAESTVMEIVSVMQEVMALQSNKKLGAPLLIRSFRWEDNQLCVAAAVESTNCQLPNLSSLRCAKLMQLELVSRRVKLGVSDETDLVKAILVVFRTVGCLNSCAADVKMYSSSLTQESKHLLSCKLAEIDASQSEDLNKLKCQLSAHQMTADLDFPSYSSGGQLVQVAETCCNLFMSSLPYIQDLDAREAGPVDNAIGVATMALLSAHCEDLEGNLHIWQALGILANALDKRPFNGRLNLDICALYGLLGAPQLALQHLERLEVKHIQMDSLASHFILPVLLGYHRTEGLRRLLIETILLFEEHDKDAGETIYTAYQRGTLTKVFEFLDFKESLELSYTYYFVLAEEGILRLTETIGAAHDALVHSIKDVCSALPVNMVDDSHLDRIRFNQDLESRSNWFSPSVRHPKMSTRGWWEGWGVGIKSEWPDTPTYQKCMKRQLRHRWLLPHILYGIWSGDRLQTSQEALVTLLNDAGVDPDTSITRITETMVSLSSASVGLMSKIETFQQITLSLGLQMALVLHEGKTKEVGLVDVYVEMWSKLVDAICSEIGQESSCAKGVDVCVSGLLSEEIPWMVYSIQALSKAIGKKAEDSSGPSLVSQAISEVVAGILKPLTKLVNQISALAQQAVTEKVRSLIAAIENKQLPESEFLHNFTIQSNAQDYFSDVIAEQQESWRLFHTMGKKLLSILEDMQL